MKWLLLILPLCWAVDIGYHKPQFDEFLQNFGKSYSGAEYIHRLQVFADNMALAAERDATDTASHGVTMFMDLTPAEFEEQVLMPAVPTAALSEACLRKGVYIPRPEIEQPDTWDWRTKPGVVNDVKNQGSCGSCWAFSTAENIEGLTGVAGKPSGSLSAQFIVDCSKSCSSELINGNNVTVCNQGCGGGWPWSAFTDIINQGGCPGWDDYPYTGQNGVCKGNQNAKVLVKVASYSCLALDKKNDNEDEIADFLVKLGPLSIALNAQFFHTYTGGIMDPAGCQTKQLNHAVLLVGFGNENNLPFWIIKNSWGTAWGEQGYVRMARGKGVCGMNEAVTCGALPA